MLLTSSRIRQSARAAISLRQDPAAAEVLHRAHALDDVGERLLGIRQRQQVVRVAPGDTRPAQVV